MSYPDSFTPQQFAEFGFVPTGPKTRIAPNSYYYLCSQCGNWSHRSRTGDKCVPCSFGKEPFTETSQYLKIYTNCCSEKECPTRTKATAWLAKHGLKNTEPDGTGRYIDLGPTKKWSVKKRLKFFLEANNFCAAHNGARQIVHPGSRGKGKLPKTDDYNAK